VIQTGGLWDSTDRHIMFAACDDNNMSQATHNQYVLIAVNELTSSTSLDFLSDVIDRGVRVFIDSGVFNLAMEHARAHECSMDEALSMAPQEIDGFDKLLDRYLTIMDRFGDLCWGYIEIDQGGAENKRKTRAMLEKKWLRPIPVYHPINDGWDYFDELASNYDRICLGNIVKADQKTRVRLLTTILNRKRDYPGLWVHGLGMAPIPELMSLPLDSVDASTWLWALRWPKWPSSASLTKVGKMPDEFFYRRGDDTDSPAGLNTATRILGFDLVASQINWRSHIRRTQEEFA
jgi:hypothetical protein